MPRLHLNVHTTEFVADDEEGIDFPCVQVAEQAAVKGIRDMLAADLLNGRLSLNGRIEIVDTTGSILATIEFKDVVQIDG